ncbi:MAG: iron donor protein CyaY [Rhodocyclaceae bacterium]|jgi:CyaY protein|nr:iron donor protein CyaY [Rhodocyclaceae bacterium]
MDDKEFAERCQQELAVIEAAIEAVADNASGNADIDFEMQGGILEVECADGSKVIVSPHAIAKEIWVAAKSGGFHFRFDPVANAWVDTRSGDPLRARLVEILKQQGQVALRLS